MPNPVEITTGLDAYKGAGALPFQAALDDPVDAVTGGYSAITDAFTGTLNVDYVYTPADSSNVPEPGSFWVVSFGVVAAGVGSGWRRGVAG